MRTKMWAAVGAMTLLVAGACTDRSVITDVGRRGISPSGASRNAVTGAVFTSTNPADDPGPGNHDLCQNQKDASAPANNCNIYFSKNFVWLSGGPGPSGLADGTYMFAVLEPGGQGGNDNPNDCTEKNLSDDPAVCPTSNTGAGDEWTHRVFSISGGVITYPASGYPGGHDFDVARNLIRLMGYDDTSNPGGEYIMAVCSLDGRDESATNQPGVDPSLCKYDAFKVDASAPCPDPDADSCFPPQGSRIETEVHLATSHTVISNASPAALGSTVHDKATVTTDGDPVPAGSQVHFYFWKNNTCDGTPFAGPDDKAISGASPASVDDGLPEGPLGAGSYSYKATFTSGDKTKVSDSEGECEPFKVNKVTLHITTDIHLDPGHTAATTVALGSTVHDRATVTGEVSGIAKGAVTFTFYTNDKCDATGTAVTNTGADGSGTGERSASSAALVAGSYSYKAVQPSDDNYDVIDDTGCEPLTVNKADATITTEVHDAAHHNITNGTASTGSYIHDKAIVGTQVGAITITGTVTFKFYENGTCTGYSVGTDETVAVGTESTPKQINTIGAYAYSAKYNGDDNYNPSSNSDCEPLSVVQLGKTMGFWGNTNGIAAIIAAGGYVTKAVAIGRGSNIDTQAEATKILPVAGNGNACGKGTPFIFVVGAQTASQNCTLASGININTLNTNSSQTLALGYNIGIVSGYSGQTIGALVCGAYVTAGLTAANTVNEAFTAAVNLINNSASGGTTTQGQLGAMNALLGCLNREVL